METATKINYVANSLGGCTCLECGAHVIDIHLHNKFHAKIEEKLKCR